MPSSKVSLPLIETGGSDSPLPVNESCAYLEDDDEDAGAVPLELLDLGLLLVLCDEGEENLSTHFSHGEASSASSTVDFAKWLHA